MLQLVKTLLFDIPDAWKIVPYWAEPPRIGYFRGLPSPPPPPLPMYCVTPFPMLIHALYPKIRFSALEKERRVTHGWLLNKSVEKARHEKYLQFSSSVNEYCSYYSLQRGRQWNTRIAHMHDNRHSRGQATHAVGRCFFRVSPLSLGGHLFNLAFVFTFVPLSRREI